MIDVLEIRKPERVKINLKALIFTLDLFFDLKRSVTIVFDRQISYHGFHEVDAKDRHFIRVGVKNMGRMTKETQMHEIMNTLMHEFYHASQHEKYGPQEYDNMQNLKNINNSRISYEYCPLELQARSFADANHMKAIEIYERYDAKIPG